VFSWPRLPYHIATSTIRCVWAQAIGSESILLRNMCCYCMVLDASSQQCSSTTHSLTSDDRGEGVSSRSRATLCDDAERRDPTSTRSRSQRNTAVSSNGSGLRSTARHNVAVQVFSEHLAPTPQQTFSTAGAGGCSPRARQQGVGLISAK
jgi:hypothetical protein